MKKFLISVAIAAAMNCTANATPVELITNGNFENGALTGWTTNSSGYSNNFYVRANGASGAVSGVPIASLTGGGNFVAVSDQTGSGGEELRQGFTVTAGMSNLTLSFDWFNNTHTSYSGTAINGSGQSGRVDILTANAGALTTGSGVVQNLLLNAGTVTSYGTTIPWEHSTFDLSGLAAGSYEIRFGNGQCCFYQEFGVDNVSLIATSAVPEPATLGLFGIAFAGLAWSRRKRA